MALPNKNYDTPLRSSNEINVRPQSTPRPRWEYDLDPQVGLKQHVDNNQPLMALEYVRRLLVLMEERFVALEAQVASLTEKKAQEKLPVHKAPRAKAEEATVEE